MPAAVRDANPSFRRRRWNLRAPDEALVPRFEALGLSNKLARVLATRANACAAPEQFVDARIKTNLFNPFELRDMDVFAERLADAVARGERVAIWGDYDVDGATSSALMARYLRTLGCEVTIRIPDRFSEGYGPNIKGLREMAQAGSTLFLVLDSGTTAFEVLGAAVAEGLDVMVLDHHAAEDTLPPVRALVNPNRRDETPGRGYLCTAGLAFVACVGLQIVLEKRGHFATHPKPNLMGLLDIAALGTVADVVPLEGLNRAIVRTGLGIMAERNNPGLKALLEVSGVRGAVQAWHLGFLLGPRINAGGRIGDSSMGARLLSSDDEALVTALAVELDTTNKERQEIEALCLAEASAQAHALLSSEAPPRFLYAVGDFHEGVVGIVAGRLKEAHDMPAVVFARTEHGTLKASARSMPGFDIGRAIIEARRAGILVAGGGHPMAGGLTIEEERLPDFVAHMNAAVAASDFARDGVVLDVDAALTPAEIKLALVDEMDLLEPFGQANARPRFLVEGLTLDKVEVVKDKHLRLSFSAPGVFMPLKAMLFNGVGQALGDAFRRAQGARVDLVAALKRNEFRGNVSLDLAIEDARLTPLYGTPVEEEPASVAAELEASLDPGSVFGFPVPKKKRLLDA